jgi:twinkle protein
MCRVVQILPYLEQFNKIIIWLGNDMKAWQSARQFARKLSDKRCFIIR